MIIEGQVVRGHQIGRTLDFPTANLRPDAPLPADAEGVWAGWLYLDGARLGCMLNVGAHPTLPDGATSIEAHIFGFSGELYGRRVRVETARYLRGETRFASLEALRAQLSRDRERALEILNIQTPAGIE